ncbi:hypothetical protein M9Y10_034529 [Tritrichomonas musculus]|uniref:Initiator binding domain-containing protein n=1 Tax=Tritrichomonas musculus TaxID=1915356 RepID=A0ABR2KID1_9EUKA
MAYELTNTSIPILSSKLPETPIEISSLLPNDMIDEIGFSPDDNIPSNKLVLNQPFFEIKRIPRTRIIPTSQQLNDQQYLISDDSQKLTSSLNCFEVKLSDCHVLAFSIYEHQEHFGFGVVVRDGAYLRYGHIVRQIPQEKCRVSVYQIIGFDENNKLGNYLAEQTQVAQSLINSFISSNNQNAKLKEIEIVSYAARAIFRISLSNSDNTFNESLTRFIVSIFAIAVEIVD